MRKVMPQEIEVWYLIPALRRELTLALVKEGMKQREVAESLGITEAAVSNYVKEKRASELKFSKAELVKISKAAAHIKEDSNTSMENILYLTNEFRGSKAVCDLHRKHDSSVSKECDLCMK